MNTQDKETVLKYLNKAIGGKKYCYLDCMSGCLFLGEHKGKTSLVWIHESTFATIAEVLLKKSIKLGENLVFSIIPGGTVIRSVIYHTLPLPPDKNVHFSSDLHNIVTQKIEINTDGTIGKIIDFSKSNLAKLISPFTLTKPSSKKETENVITAYKITIYDTLYEIISREAAAEEIVKDLFISMAYEFISFESDIEKVTTFFKELEKSKFSVKSFG